MTDSQTHSTVGGPVACVPAWRWPESASAFPHPEIFYRKRNQRERTNVVARQTCLTNEQGRNTTLLRHWKTANVITAADAGCWRVEYTQRVAKEPVPFIRRPMIPSHERAHNNSYWSFFQRYCRIDSCSCINTPSSSVAGCSKWRKIEKERWTKNDEWPTIWRPTRPTGNFCVHIGRVHHAGLS